MRSSTETSTITYTGAPPYRGGTFPTVRSHDMRPTWPRCPVGSSRPGTGSCRSSPGRVGASGAWRDQPCTDFQCVCYTPRADPARPASRGSSPRAGRGRLGGGARPPPQRSRLRRRGRREPDRAAPGLVLVVDYAERWPLADLITLVRQHRDAARDRLRILLLARPARTWWQGLAHQFAKLDILDVDAIQTRGAAGQTPAVRTGMYTAARDRFAEIFGLADSTSHRGARTPRRQACLPSH